MSCYFYFVYLCYCLFGLSCDECDVISLYCMRRSVNGSVCLVCCLFDSVCELFGKIIRNMLGCVVVILLLNVWKSLVWVKVLCWIDRVWSSKECVCCACDPSVHLSVSSIGFVYVLYVGSYLLI